MRKYVINTTPSHKETITITDKFCRFTESAEHELLIGLLSSGIIFYVQTWVVAYGDKHNLAIVREYDEALALKISLAKITDGSMITITCDETDGVPVTLVARTILVHDES